MTDDPGTHLLDSIHQHNPWWSDGITNEPLPDRYKSDFYHLVRPNEPDTQFQDQEILGLVGRRGVGKTTLLKQFIDHELTSQSGSGERFLYVPFDADPLYQLQSDAQLRQVIRYYEARILGRLDDPDPHFLILDDVHQVEHPTKPDVEGWGTPVSSWLAEAPDGRHVVLTANAGVQLRRELGRVSVSEHRWDLQPILPEKFRDYLYTLYPSLESAERRISPTSLRSGAKSLPHAVETGEVDAVVSEIQSKFERVGDVAGRIQSQVIHYLAMGGVLAYDHGGAVDTASELSKDAYADLWAEVRTALYQDVPGFETIQTIADLERLCAIAAHQPPSEPVSFQRLSDLFDVDRRTIRDSYLMALSTLYLVTGSLEYDNQRPRGLRLYLRDTGLATAITAGGPGPVLNEFEREAQLAELAAFDHTVRFAYNIRALHGDRARPDVWYWEGERGTVDFVFELGDVPVPIGFAYRPGTLEAIEDTVAAFNRRYGSPVGFVVTGDTVRPDQAPSIEYAANEGVLTLPFWFYLLLC